MEESCIDPGVVSDISFYKVMRKENYSGGCIFLKNDVILYEMQLAGQIKGRFGRKAKERKQKECRTAE
ncbi:MAG: hypothetical protein SPK68_05215 [Lachnospiraceae bacterium]|nr:hypothetical protein [Lachnospiraceae bacterium]